MNSHHPDWFTYALDQPYESREIDLDGTRITYRAWGKSGGAPVVLVHGGAAHAGWWDSTAPFLAAEHRVIAIDLSGHGDSDRREKYSLATWAAEVMAVAAAESDQVPVVFGHSMGGFVALTAGRDHGSSLRGVAAIDSPVRELSAEAKAWIAEGGHGDIPGNKVYPDRETILGRFRTLPEDTSTLSYVKDHLAEGSIKQVDGGWTWKFDPHIFLSSRMEPEELAAIDCEVGLIRGERGMATTDITDLVAERLGGDVPVTLIPDAGHHIMLDQPIALIAVLQTLLGQWRRHD
jgi:pimeloyl-ACP methyl ester carboxylesterase